MKRAILGMSLLMAAGSAATPPFATSAHAATPQASARQEDPAAQLYREARELLNAERFRDAAVQFERLRGSYANSTYVPDTFYWQAFALYREGGASNLRTASDLLRTQAQRHPGAATRADAEQLLVRIESLLAQRGDAVPSQGRSIDHIGFRPINVDAAVAELKSRNVTITTEPRPLTFANGVTARIAFAVAPDGVRIELVQRPE